MGFSVYAAKRIQFPLVVAILQIVFVFLMWKFVNYAPTASALTKSDTTIKKAAIATAITDNRARYAMFQDVHVMIFIGFGFLMTFLHRYSFSAVSYNLILAAITIQYSIVIRALINNIKTGMQLSLTGMILADFDCAIVLISFGALLGKTTPIQLLIMLLLEIPIAQANAYLAEQIFHAADIGGSMIIHTFGAYFGLGAALALTRGSTKDNANNGSSYTSDIFSMIGTVFLWVFWPSFNGALADNDLAERAIINTYLALTAATISTFIFSLMSEPRGRFKMVTVQNATLAGGVGVGAVANFMLFPFGAILVGFAAGALSVFGFSVLQGALEKIRIHDTCGVHNLHGMPGVMSGIASVIGAAIASKDLYGDGLYSLFPNRAPTSPMVVQLPYGNATVQGKGWSANHQALMQLATLGCTLGLSIVGGLLTGAIMRLPYLDQMRPEQLFRDNGHWEVPEKEEPENVKSKSSYTVNTMM